MEVILTLDLTKVVRDDEKPPSEGLVTGTDTLYIDVYRLWYSLESEIM